MVPFAPACGLFVIMSSLLSILLEEKGICVYDWFFSIIHKFIGFISFCVGKQSVDHSNFIFQTLMRFLVGMDFYVDNQTESPSILVVHKTSGNIFFAMPRQISSQIFPYHFPCILKWSCWLSTWRRLHHLLLL